MATGPCDMAQPLTSDRPCSLHLAFLRRSEQDGRGPGVTGEPLKGHFHPLPSSLLRAALRSDKVLEVALREQEEMIEAAVKELLLFRSRNIWLLEVHQVIRAWDEAAVDEMHSWRPEQFQEHISRLRKWEGRVKRIHRSWVCRNQLLELDCSYIQQEMVPALVSMLQQVLGVLKTKVEQQLLQLTTDLTTAIKYLLEKPTETITFGTYTSRLDNYNGNTTDYRQQLDYILALVQIVRVEFQHHASYQDKEEEQVEYLWNTFLQECREASEFIRSQRDSALDTLEQKRQLLDAQMQSINSNVSSASFRDPSRNAAATLQLLQEMREQIQSVARGLQELSQTQNAITGQPLDLSFVSKVEANVNSRRELWNLFYTASQEVKDWRKTLLTQFDLQQVQSELDGWLSIAERLRASVPADDKILLAFDEVVSEFKLFLPILADMSLPEMKERHWKSIFTEIGETWHTEWQMKISDLLAYNLPAYSEFIRQVLAKERKESELHKLLLSVKRFWQSCEFRLVTHIAMVHVAEPHPNTSQRPHSGKFQPPEVSWTAKDSGTLILIEIERLQWHVEDSVMTLSRILSSSAPAGVQEEAGKFMEVIEHFGELLDLWKNFQDKWVFLHQIFSEMELKARKPDLVMMSNIKEVNVLYRRVIEALSTNPSVLSVIHGQDTLTYQGMTLWEIFSTGIAAMEEIIVQMSQILESARQEFPRLHFLSDNDLFSLFILLPDPRKLLPFVRKCFVNVQDLQYEMTGNANEELIMPQTNVLAIYGQHRERLELLVPLEPGYSVVTWLQRLELSIQQSLFRSLESCISESTASAAHTNSTILESLDKTNAYKAAQLMGQVMKLVQSYPAQCILIAETMCWQQDVEKVLFTHSASKAWFTALYSAKVDRLALAAHRFCKSMTQETEELRLLSLLKSLILTVINHRDLSHNLMATNIESETSFHWQKLLKYKADFNWLFPKREATNPSVSPFGPSTPEPQQRQFGLRCYINVLSINLYYDYEYVGPSHQFVHTPLTERTCLALLLGIQNFNACALVGPCGTGKSATLSHLAHALGSHLVTLQCCEGMSMPFLTQILRGAVQSGAWVLLKDTDFLTRGMLSILGQHLITIQNSYRELIKTYNPWKQDTDSPQRQLGRSLTNVTGSDNSPLGHRRMWSSEGLRLLDPTALGSIVFEGSVVPARITYATIMTFRAFDSSITLPENLRMVLRPVSVVRPDVQVISEVKLLSLGFLNPGHLARKITLFFEVARDSGFIGDHCCLPMMGKVVTAAAKVLYRRLQAITSKMGSSSNKGPSEGSSSVLAPGLSDRGGQGTDGGSEGGGEVGKHPSVPLFESIVLLEEYSVLSALLTTLSSAASDHEHQQNLQDVLRDLFPVAWATLPQQDHTPDLLSAIKQELVDTEHEVTEEMVTNILALHQALRGSKGVIIFGPSGSGKTTSYRILSRVMNQLCRSDPREPDNSGGDELTGLAVKVSVYFPNSLSTKELLGALKQRTWKKGVLTRRLSKTGRWIQARALAKDFKSLQVKPFSRPEPLHWMVLDGELCLDWLLPISSLLAQGNCLTLPDGEQLSLPESTSLILEVSDLSDATPAAVTWSSLVHYQGSGCWEAVYNHMIDSVYSQYTVHRETLALWRRLALDLIPNTLQFLQHCTLALNPQVGCLAVRQKMVTYGLQEVMTFNRILDALLRKYLSRHQQQVQMEHGAVPPGGPSTTSPPQYQRRHLDDGILPRDHMLARSILAVAYIWGFGGHLQSSHWPRFDNFARHALESSAYPIQIPQPGLVFDYYINPTSGCLETLYRDPEEEMRRTKVSGYVLVPEMEIYLKLLEQLLSSGHSVFLVGEPLSGKTSFVQAMKWLSSLPPMYRLPVSPSTLPRDVWQHVAGRVFPRDGEPPPPPRTPAPSATFLFLLDDVHVAASKPGSQCQPVVEAVRHSLTCRGIYNGDCHRFRSFHSTRVSYIATCSPCHGAVGFGSARLTHLTTVLALPAITWGMLTTIYMPSVLTWLESFPRYTISRHALFAKLLVHATIDLYRKVKEVFLASPRHPHYLFSLADVGKVLRGLLLMHPSSVSTLKKLSEDKLTHSESEASPALQTVTKTVVGLWLHESMRTFSDCLLAEEDRTTLCLILEEVAHSHFSTHNVEFLFNHSLLRRIVEPQTLGSQSDQLEHHQGNFPFSLEMQDADEQGEASQGEDIRALEPKNQFLISQQRAELSSGALSTERLSREASETESLLLSFNDQILSTSSVVSSRFSPPQVTLQAPATKLRDPRGKLGAASPKYARSRVQNRGRRQSMSIKPLLPLHLLYTGEALTDLIFSKGAVRPDSRQQMSSPRWNPYREVSHENLAQQLRQVVQRQNLSHRTSHQIIFFKDTVRHFAHISRVLSTPRAHCALMATTHCTGRKTLVRLAAYLTMATVFELDGQMSSSEVASVFKQANRQAGIQERCTIIMVHSSVGQDTLQELFNVMAEGRFPGLYSPSELTQVAKQFAATKNLAWNLKEERVLERFFQAVAQSLHVVLLLPVGDSSLSQGVRRLPVRLAHLLGPAGYIDVWCEWGHQALTDIAASHLGFGNLSTLTRSTDRSVAKIWVLVPIIIRIMALIHQSALSYAKHMARPLPLITPHHYLDFIDLFLMMFHHLEQSEGLQIERMELGLDKIKEVYNSAEEHTKEIELLKRKLELLAEEKRQLQEHYAKLRNDFLDLLLRSREEEFRLTLLQREMEAARRTFNNEHGAGKPLYETALQALKALSSSDLDEVRTYRAPPLSVVTVMNTLCLMFDRPEGWENVKQLISQPNFYQDLECYEKDNIPDHIFKTLGNIILRRELQPDIVRGASRAVESFSLWIRAVYYHAVVAREYSPIFINQFQSLIDEVQGSLGLLRKQAFERKKVLMDLLREDGEGYLSDTESLMDVGDTDVLKLLQQKEQHLVRRLREQEDTSLAEMRHQEQELQQSKELIQALYPHQSDWNKALQQSRDRRVTVLGDGLLTAAAVIYLGPFVEETRQELLEKWKVACYSGRMQLELRDARQELLQELADNPASSQAEGSTDPGIPSRNNFLLLDILSSLREQLEWNRIKLPVNATARVSILITQTLLRYSPTPWILLVDPDQQARIWMGVLQAGGGPRLEQDILGASAEDVLPVEDAESEGRPGDILADSRADESGEITWVPELITEQPPDNLWVCSITNESLDQLLLTAAANGIGVLVTNIELCPFPPILRALLRVSRWQVGMDSWDLTFGTLRVQVKPTFRLYLSTSLSLRRIESEMDPIFLKQVRVIDLTISQSGLQELFLKEVLYFERQRVEDLNLTCQKDIMYLQHQLQVTQEELMDKVIQTATSLLNDQSIREAALQNQRAKMEIRSQLNALNKPSAAMENPYVVISNIGSEMYWALVHISRLSNFYYFSKLSFMKVVRAALSSRSLGVYHQLPSTGSSKDHYMDLMDYLICRIYNHFHWCMFVSHARLYRFLVAIGHMKVVNTVTKVEWELFLRGIQDLKLDSSLQNSPHVRPAWVSEQVWQSCAVLELLPAFHNLRDSLVKHGSQWQEYLRLSCTVIGSIPCPGFGQLSTFQKAILWRFFQPNMLSVVMNDVVTCELGGTLIRDLWLTIPSIYNYSYPRVPVMFLMPRGSSVNLSTHPLYWIEQVAAEQRMQNKVRIISLGSENQTEEILQELKAAVSKGRWLVLNNCHLLGHWDKRLVSQLTQLITTFEIPASTEAAPVTTLREDDPCKEDSGKPVPTVLTESGQRIHLDFRLWLTCRNEADCSMPGVIRRHVEKLVIETPSMLQSTLKRTYTQAQTECGDLTHLGPLTVLTALHSILLHRQHYSHWAQARSYRWTQADLFAALNIQRNLQATWGDTEVLLEHLVVAVYQGHVLDKEDEVALRSIINHCVRTSSQASANKGIRSLIIHLTSSTGELTPAETQRRIERMPSRMEAAAGGLGPERRLPEERAADTSHMLAQSQTPAADGGAGPSGAERLLDECLSRLRQLCGPGASGQAGTSPEAGSAQPLHRFLLRERRCLQLRLQRRVCALNHAREAQQGARACSPGTRQLCAALERGCVPCAWWPGARGPAPLPLWLRRVEVAVRLLDEYARGPVPAAAYNLSAFRRPRAFLLSVLQQRAREEQRALDTYRVHAQVLSSFLPPTSPPENGVYITGLQLHGALWDSRLGLLQDTLSIKPCSMPVVWLRAEKVATETAGSPSLPRYECPVYLGAEGEAMDLTDTNIITHLSLASKMDPLVCAQRRVHIATIL
ncbi:dynein heavy chain domain-containing protein 1 [Pristis pectinata]|uniref:dynein heavy chain domain-containing protein 1 n=1 Tax=Pristis pectinata TaxID=685728 RepID=UPI00223CD744|nr:dynein heavy chain domain-containing protein 1 [Pristis pectinata]